MNKFLKIEYSEIPEIDKVLKKLFNIFKDKV